MISTLHAPDHVPVLLEEVLNAASFLQQEQLCVDGTFGAGGYSRALLSRLPCAVYGIDQDPDVQPYATALANDYPERFCFLQGSFGDMEALLAAKQVTQVDAVILDLGVSSMQLDRAERGFSFSKEGPLDMRMSQQGESAADVIHSLSEKELADIIYRYGDERYSRKIARAIVECRNTQSITTTTELANIIVKHVGRYNDAIHPATRTFQAIRIYLNREMEQLESALAAAERLLAPGGRLIVVTFHSLEDGIVKQFLRDASTPAANPSRHIPLLPDQLADNASLTFKLHHKKPILPSAAEIKRNPRARSAKLRVAVRTDAPARDDLSLTKKRGKLC